MDTRRSRFIQYGSGASADCFFKGGAANWFTKAPDGSIWMDPAHGLYHQAPDGSFKQVQFLPGTVKNIPVEANAYISNGLIYISPAGDKRLAFALQELKNRRKTFENGMSGAARLELRKLFQRFGVDCNELCTWRYRFR